MNIQDLTQAKNENFETLSSYINSDIEYKISVKALFLSFKYRSKVESLKFFIV